MPIDYGQLLPPELWLEIFRWATASPKEFDLNTAYYVPFRISPIDVPDATIRVKINLTLVCRTWKDLTATFLYENLRIHRDFTALRDTLVNHENFGKLVRRVVLPYRSTVTTTYQSPLPSYIEILKHCTNLETLVRPRLMLPESLQFHFDADKLVLESLQRLDWWYHHEAERSGGINSLAVVLHHTPNLRYLSVGGVAGHIYVPMKSTSLALPKLYTLRLFGANGHFLRQLTSHWSLPKLSTIIVDFPLAQLGLCHLWETFGARLQTVEFGKHVRFRLDDHITTCIEGCPNLRELNYFLFYTMPPTPGEDCRSSLVTIGLHAAVNQQFQSGPNVCSHIEEHFSAIMGHTFPALQKIILYGDWRGIMAHPPLTRMWQTLHERRLTVVVPGRDNSSGI